MVGTRSLDLTATLVCSCHKSTIATHNLYPFLYYDGWIIYNGSMDLMQILLQPSQCSVKRYDTPTVVKAYDWILNIRHLFVGSKNKVRRKVNPLRKSSCCLIKTSQVCSHKILLLPQCCRSLQILISPNERNRNSRSKSFYKAQQKKTSTLLSFQRIKLETT